MMDYERSLALAEKMDYHYIPGCCWANALQALRLQEKHLGHALYVEGWCAMPEISMVQEHGWLELQDGTILDPTYAAADHGQGKRLQYNYFPALRYRLNELKGVRLHSLPRIWKTGGFGGLRNEAYYAAMNSAYQLIGYPALERQPGMKEQSHE
jgi:hypothetical protein